MKYATYAIFPIYFLLLTGLGCKKKNSFDSELSKLPPITQNGAGTFGCLVNGKAWTPKGYTGNTTNLIIFIDPGFQNGNFDLRTYRKEDDMVERINIFSNDIRQVGTFVVSPVGKVYVDYRSSVNNCSFTQSADSFLAGVLKISKYDVQNRIVAGEFEFRLHDKAMACDTIKITNGRFDYKL